MRAKEPERVAEPLAVLVLESSGVISAGSRATGQLPSEAVYEYIETISMDERVEEPEASQNPMQEEDYDDAEEPTDSPED